MIQLKGIQKTYHNKNNDVEALKDVSLHIVTNGITMILGASGCGKTTLLNIISGVDRDYKGHVEVVGKVAYIEQEIKLLESMSVYDNLYLVNADKQRIEELLKQFHLWDERTKKVKKLSTGQKKRVQVLRTLLSNPDVLLCDEPTAALDHDNAVFVMEALAAFANDIPVLMVTHEIAISQTYANRICRMEDGEIVEDVIVQPVIDTTTKPLKTSKKASYAYFLRKSLFARKGESVFHFLFAFVFILTLYISGTFFLSTNQASDEKNSWNTGANVLISQPKDGNEVLRKGDEGWENPYTQPYYYYDLYTPKDVMDIMAENPSIIGYKAGWNFEKYNNVPTFTPFLTLDETKQAIQDYEDTGLGNEAFVEHMRKDIEKSDGRLSFVDRENIRGIRGGDDTAIDMIVIEDILFLQNHDFEYALNADVMVYQMKKSYEIPLIYGKQIQQDNEIIIPYKLAEKFARTAFHEANEKTIQSILGLEFSAQLGMYVPDERISSTSTSKDDRTYEVVGITMMDNANENRMYMQEGAYDNFRNTACDMKEETLIYQYISFLMKPDANFMSISEQVNEMHPGVESSFVPFQESSNTQTLKQAYKNPMVFASVGVFVIGGCVLLLIIYETIIRKRQMKEEEILRIYSYSPGRILFFHSIVYFIPIILLIGFTLPVMIQWINSLVRAFGYSDIVSYRIIPYMLCTVSSLAIYLVLRGGFYVVRAKKSS